MKKRGKKLAKPSKKFWIGVIIAIIFLLIIAVAVYLLFFNEGGTIFGFKVPDFSGGAKLGDIGNALDANAWDDIQLNPFEEGA